MRRPALTVTLAIQPGVWRRLGDVPEFRERGLVPRFLPSLPASLVGRRDPHAPPMPPRIAAEYAARVRKLLDLPPPPERETGPESIRLPLAPAARTRFLAFRARIEVALGPSGALRPFADWGSKLPGRSPDSRVFCTSPT